MENLWDGGTPLVVGVSGGGDSMALMGLLAATLPQKKLLMHPVHIDHGLRQESGAEASWVAHTIFARWGFETEVITPTIVQQSGESVEMAARRVRYTAFNRVAKELGSSCRIVVAHHYDDQVETVLMRILVGTGIPGLGGMRPVQGRVIRPLLSIRRQTLHQYLKDMAIPWLEDATNTHRTMLRNRIRHEILPMLANAVNPRVDVALTRLADQARRASEEMSGWAREFLDSHHIDLTQSLVVLPASLRTLPKTRLLSIFSEYGLVHNLRLSQWHLEQALDFDITWPHGVMVRHRSDRIELTVPSHPSSYNRFGDFTATSITVGQPIAFRGGTLIVDLESKPQVVGEGEWTSVINATKWPTLAVRGWMPGDALRPIGLKGTKKLQDLFVDKKISRPWRHRWPIITGGVFESAPILAVIGLSLSEEAKPEPGSEGYRVRWNPSPNKDWREIRS